jgi:hypothetical protein
MELEELIKANSLEDINSTDIDIIYNYVNSIIGTLTSEELLFWDNLLEIIDPEYKNISDEQ